MSIVQVIFHLELTAQNLICENKRARFNNIRSDQTKRSFIYLYLLHQFSISCSRSLFKLITVCTNLVLSCNYVSITVKISR